MSYIALARAPHTYRYNSTDVREDVIISQLSYVLGRLDVPHRIFDFHLQRDLHASAILSGDPSAIVISVRETGDNVHYAFRLARYLRGIGARKVILYGQTARLRGHPLLPKGIEVLAHNEQALVEALGISGKGPEFGKNLLIAPYINKTDLARWQRRRRRGTVETSRGCPFPCSFCFINSGHNHATRWQVQSTEETLNSLAAYGDAGITSAVFHDSEFFGGGAANLRQRKQLISAIGSEFPELRFKIYARADTLLAFGQLDELKKSGLVSVFIGVESFVQSDLDALHKRQPSETTLQAIRALAERQIYMDLSFILFHRRTTTRTLRENLERILELYSGPSARLMGVPHFTFSFESAWSDETTRELSQDTYVHWDVQMKSPRPSGVRFDPALEPLMEIYRLLAYEWSRKVVELSLARDDADIEVRRKIEVWFSGLGAFCARTMLKFLGDFEAQRLDANSLPDARARLFSAIADYYSCLPSDLAGFSTFDEHATLLEYGSNSQRLEDDEYWLKQIPDIATRADRAATVP